MGLAMSFVDFRSSIDVSTALASGDVRLLIRTILERAEVVSFSSHALDELAKDDLSTVDAVNVLRCWRYMDVAEQDMRTGEWKYRIHTELMGVVVKFRSVAQIHVITVWRK
jgi:hypothetical protein